MWRRVLGGLPIAAVAAAALAGAPAANAQDVTITSFDGTKIAAHWFVGQGVGPGQRAPTILEGPGWSSGGDTGGGGGASGLGAIFGVPGIDSFISHGYNVLTWDPRGFGQSGGTVEIDDPDFEARDVEALIDWVAKQPEAEMDQSCTATQSRKRTRHNKRRRQVTCATSPHDPTIGMAGASYGGGIQLVTAALDKRIDAIAPTIAWHSLLTSLFPEGNIKLGWGSILIAAGVEGSVLPGGLSAPVTAAGRQDPHFYSILANGLATGTTTQDDRNWMAAHGPGDLVNRIQIPTLLMQGTVDTLFPLDEGVTNLEQIQDNPLRTAAIKAKAKAKKKKKRKRRHAAAPSVQTVPVKMIWFCGGHGVCLTGAGPGSGYLDQRTIAWFDRYLRGKQDVDTGPRFAWIADDAQLRTSDAYPLARAGQLHASGSGTLPIVPGQGSGGLIFATAAANGLNLAVPGPSSDANVVGAPHLDLTYSGKALPAKTWIYAQFVNPRNGTVLGNDATPIPVTLDGQQHPISRDLEMVAARAPAGGGYTLQLTPSSSLFDIQRSAGAVTFNQIDVTMPLGDPVGR